MAAARACTLDARLDDIKRMLSAVHEAAMIFKAQPAQMISQVSSKYHLTLADAELWYSTVDIRAERYVRLPIKPFKHLRLDKRRELKLVASLMYHLC
jgi:hypothetical protein